MKEVRIIEVKEIQTKEGQKFLAYKTVTKSGKKVDVRFTRTCNNIPTKPCTLLVADENINLDNSYQYPKFWIKKIEEVKETENKVQDLSEYF